MGDQARLGKVRQGWSGCTFGTPVRTLKIYGFCVMSTLTTNMASTPAKRRKTRTRPSPPSHQLTPEQMAQFLNAHVCEQKSVHAVHKRMKQMGFAMGKSTFVRRIEVFNNYRSQRAIASGASSSTPQRVTAAEVKDAGIKLHLRRGSEPILGEQNEARPTSSGARASAFPSPTPCSSPQRWRTTPKMFTAGRGKGHSWPDTRR